jgi:hypothetical protein
MAESYKSPNFSSFFFEIIVALLFHDELLYPDPKAARVCDL